MGFSTDETLLNSINLDSINQYRQFIDQIKPILMEEAGYEYTPTTKNAGFTGGGQAYKAIRATGYYSGKLSKENAAKQFGMTQDEFGKVATLAKQYHNLSYHRGGHPDIDTSMAALDKQISEFTVGSQKLQKTAAQLAKEAEMAEIEKQQMELTKAQAERQRKALAGEIETSPILQKQIQDEFNVFKENQARAGNVIVGDNIENAVGKGTAAIESLARFKDNATAAKQREIDSIVNQTPLYYQGLGISSDLTQTSPYQSDFGGLSSLSLSAMQPFQFNRQMNVYQAINSKNQSKKSGLGTALGGLAGAAGGYALGNYLMPGVGGMPGAQIGMGLGSGFGSLF